MKLEKYFKRKDAKSRREVADKSGVSYYTVKNAANGMKLSRYDVAKAISDATGGLVTVADLCE